jgi:hypothetical protein
MRQRRLTRLVFDALAPGTPLTPSEVLAFIGKRRIVWPWTFADVWWILYSLEQEGTVASEWVAGLTPRNRRYWLTSAPDPGTPSTREDR